MTDSGKLNLVIAALVSADNNVTIEQRQKNIAALKQIKEKLSDEYESYRNKCEKYISILQKEIDSYSNMNKE